MNLENGDYKVKLTHNFMGIRIYGYIFSLLQAKQNNKNIYFCVFNHGTNSNLDNGQYFSIKRFGLQLFDFNSINNEHRITNNNNQYNHIINGFIMEEDSIIVVFYMHHYYPSNIKYNLNFYDFDLNVLRDQISIGSQVQDPFYDGIFFKGLYLYQKYAAIMYFLKHNDGKTLYLEILNMNFVVGNYGINSLFKKNINKYDFATYISLSEFLKIDNDRLVYISTTSTYNNLYIIFFDFYNTYSILKTRMYYLNLPNLEFQQELSACIYNNFLVFTGRVYYTNSQSTFSIFLIFGFPKGKDNIINILPYFYDSELYDPNMNLVYSLLDDFMIDNNLFGYEKMNKMRLNQIPEEIIFYNESKNIPLSNGDIINENYRLTYNKELIKENKYYELGYQYMVIEPNIEDFYNQEEIALNHNTNNFNNDYIERRVYYGRTNLLKFKLCHNLCEKCKIYGISNYNQKCTSCPYINDYNYFTYAPFNCLAEGYFQDNELEKIIKCNDTNSKFYYDIERNKTICFKYLYNCPYGYSNFNATTNECERTFNFNTIIHDLKESNYTNEYILSHIIPEFIKNYDGKNNVIEVKR